MLRNRPTETEFFLQNTVSLHGFFYTNTRVICLIGDSDNNHAHPSIILTFYFPLLVKSMGNFYGCKFLLDNLKVGMYNSPLRLLA